MEDTSCNSEGVAKISWVDEKYIFAANKFQNSTVQVMQWM